MAYYRWSAKKRVLGSALVLGGLLILFLQTSYPHNLLKKIVESELSKTLKQPVSIQRVSGNLLFSATFHGIQFKNRPGFTPGSVIDIGTMRVFYNPITALFLYRGDFARASHVIDIYNTTVTILRDKRDRWNILEVLPPAIPGSPPPTFHGKLFFHNLTITLRDEHGWGAEPSLFTENLGTFQGKMDFKYLRKVPLEFSNRDSKTSAAILELKGLFNVVTGGYDVVLSGSRVDLKKWGNYTFNHVGYSFTNGSATLRGTIKSKETYVPHSIPFWYNLSIVINQGEGVIPYLTKPVSKISATIQLQDWKRGRTISPATLVFHSSEGVVDGAKTSLSGTIFPHAGFLDLRVQANFPTLSQLWTTISGLSPFQFTGSPCITQARISGPFSSVQIQGNLDVSSGNVYGVNLSNVLLNFTLQNRQLQFNIARAFTQGSPVTGSGTVDLRGQSPYFDVHFKSEGLHFSDFAAALKPYEEGTFGANLSIVGNSSQLTVSANAIGNQATFMGQSIQKILVNVAISTRSLDVLPSRLYVNDGVHPIVFSGSGPKSSFLTLSIVGDRIPISDFLSASPSHPKGEAFFTVQSNVPLSLSKLNSSVPIGHTVAKGDLNQPQFKGQRLDRLSFEFSYQDSLFDFKTLKARFASQNLSFEGKIEHFLPVTGYLKISRLDVDHWPVLYEALPDILKPLSGRLSFEGSIFSLPLPAYLAHTKTWGWASKLSVAGDLSLRDGRIQNQRLDSLSLQGKWDGRALNISSLVIQHNHSEASFSGLWNPDRFKINIAPSTHFLISDFSTWLSGLGKLDGNVTLFGHVEKTGPHYVSHLNLDSRDLKGEFLSFERVFGEFTYADGIASLTPVQFIKDQHMLQLEGRMNIRPLFSSKIPFSDLDYNGKISVDRMNVDAFITILEGVRNELHSRFGGQSSGLPVPSGNLATIRLGSPKNIPIYRAEMRDPSYLAYFSQKYQEARALYTLQPLMFHNLLSGVMSGAIQAQSRKGRFPLLSGKLLISTAQISFVRSDSFLVEFNEHNGNVGFDLSLEKGQWGPKSFQLIEMGGFLDENSTIHLTKSRLKTPSGGDYTDVISGYYPFKHGAISLSIDLQKDAIGLLGAANPIFKDITNEGRLTLHLTGNTDQLSISASEFSLKNAAILFSPEITGLTSPFKILQAAPHLNQNRLSLNSVRVDWRGTDTQSLDQKNQVLNTFYLSGDIALSPLSLKQFTEVKLGIHLRVPATTLTVFLPQFYRGEVVISDFHIDGDYVIPLGKSQRKAFDRRLMRDLEEGPVLSGKIALDNAEVIMPSLKQRSPKPSVLLNLDLAIGRDVRVVGSLLDQEFINNFDLHLEQTSTPIKVLGSLNYPKPQRPLIFSEGDVQIFNRTFSLLTPDQQRLYFPDNQTKTLPNSISFSLIENRETGTLRFVPVLQAMAYSVVDPDPIDPVTQEVVGESAKYRHILVSIDGPVYSLKSFTFDKFISDSFDPKDPRKSFSGSVSLGDPNSSDRVMEILLPDLNDSVAKNNLDTQTTRLIGQVGENQINSILRKQVRPIEKQLAKNIGLYDIRVDYNLGGALLRSTNVQGLGSDNRNLGVNFMKGLFSDQLLLRVKTNLDTQTQQSNDIFWLSEIELTYYFTKNLSAGFSSAREESNLSAPPKSSWILKYRYEY